MSRNKKKKEKLNGTFSTLSLKEIYVLDTNLYVWLFGPMLS